MNCISPVGSRERAYVIEKGQINFFRYHRYSSIDMSIRQIISPFQKDRLS